MKPSRHRQPSTLPPAAAVLLAALVVTGCSVERIPFTHQIEVEQGDVLDQEAVDQLEEGMPRSRVRQILGEPALNHPFHADRWDYVYSIRGGSQTATERHLTLHFDGDDRIARIEGDREWADARPDTDRESALPVPTEDPQQPAPGPGGGQQPPPQPGPQGGP